MKINKPKNENYAATVVEIKNIIPIVGSDNIVHTNIFGNLVIVGKDTLVGTKGIYFPAETKLSADFLKYNNLYRKPELNTDNTKKGYFEENGRIRAVKLRGNTSMGLFMPISCVEYVADVNELNIGDTFDEINDVSICEKYIPKNQYSKGERNKNMGKVKRVSILVDKQFRLHYDTSHFGKNIHLFNLETLVSITRKLHGTSVVISKVLINKNISVWQKFLKLLGADINTTEYGNVYASRKVVKNEFAMKDKTNAHFYKEDIWKLANDEIKDFLSDGMTVYGEIVGYLPSGGGIQGKYDYDCNPGEHKLYIYRITYTNPSGDVFEFSAKQVQEWCRKNAVNAVPEVFYGKIKEVLPDIDYKTDNWRDSYLVELRNKYLEKDCEICKNKLPDEGIVIRDEVSGEAFKYKSFAFLEKETKDLDAGVVDIEESISDDI